MCLPYMVKPNASNSKPILHVLLNKAKCCFWLVLALKVVFSLWATKAMSHTQGDIIRLGTCAGHNGASGASKRGFKGVFGHKGFACFTMP